MAISGHVQHPWGGISRKPAARLGEVPFANKVSYGVERAKELQNHGIRCKGRRANWNFLIYFLRVMCQVAIG